MHDPEAPQHVKRIRFFLIFGFPIFLCFLLFRLVSHRSQDLDSLFPFSNLTSKFLSPCLVARHMACFRPLQVNQKRVIETVMWKFRHGFQICFVFFAVKNPCDTIHQLIHQFLYLFIHSSHPLCAFIKPVPAWELLFPVLRVSFHIFSDPFLHF